MDWLGKIVSISSLAEKAVEKVADCVKSLVESEVSRYRSVEEELKRLERTSERINKLLTDAEERRYIEDDSVKQWLRDLKSVSYDTDNLLDEYRTALAVYRLQHSSNAGSSHKRKWHQIELPSISPEWGPIRRRNFASEIDKINKRLEEIHKGRKHLRLRGQDGARRDQPRLARPFLSGLGHDPAAFVGRENEINEIVGLLTSDLRPVGDSTPTVPVVPIHGAPGIGKTTLARMIYDDQRIGEYFNLKAWVFLTERSDVKNVMKEIYEKITGEGCDLQALDASQNRLREHLKTRPEDKFLLVIDNLWAEEFPFWEALRVPLLAGGEGSKVLITTRNEKICRIMHALPRRNLSGLDDNMCWQLLKSLALPEHQDINDIDHDRLVDIGKKIAKRCHGSPLAAKMLGTLLNGAREEEWSDVLSEMRALKDDQNGILATIKISYHHLPYHIKQCFAYCAIFPNGYKFERDQLVRYWLAEGLIQLTSQKARPEAIGLKYFDNLVWRSFFEKSPVCDNSRVERYIMPSLMYDFARLVSEYEFRELKSDLQQFESEGDHQARVRYLSLLHHKGKPHVKLESTEPYQNLRTLKLCDECGEWVVPLNPIKAQFFRKFVNLRVLDLSNSSLECVPDSISVLIHLRYLGLSNTEIKTLPEKICDLYNLQTLELKGCLKLKRLPEGMHRLVKLRHLDLHLDWEEITDKIEVMIPPRIGELEHLQTLSRFNVTSNSKGQECNINELKDLNLREDLCILNLERVLKHEDAMNANLRGKKYIENLMLRWHESAHSNGAQRQHSEEVLHHLQPHNRLRHLWLMNYPGTSFPSWMGVASFSSLEMIRISNCYNFSFLVLLGRLPRLRNLKVDNVPAKTMDDLEGFPSLEQLSLLNLHYLKRLSLKNEIPKLKNIDINDCPYLKELIIHPNLDGKIQRRNCHNLTIILSVPRD